MFPRGHAGIALIAYSPVYLAQTELLSVLTAICVMWAAVIPDMDVSNRLVLRQLNHRGLTHTVWFAGIAGVVSYGVFVTTELLINSMFDIQLANYLPTYTPILLSISVGVGVLLHLAGDVINIRAGVRPFSFIDSNNSGYEFHYPLIDGHTSRNNNTLFVIGVSVLAVVTLSKHLL